MLPLKTQRVGAGALELVIAFCLVLVLLLAQLAVSRTFRLIYHPLWLDECLTYALANDPSFGHEMSALRGGVDTNPPLLYLMLRPLKWTVEELGAVELRLFSAAFMIVALVGIYATCRRFFDLAASWIGLLSLLVHPALVEQIFEARGYSVWLAATAWFCYCLFLIDSSKSAKIAGILLSVVAVTIHWFGVAVIALISIVDLLMHRSMRRLIPLLVGVVAVLLCLPFLVGQRADLAIPTWMEPTDSTQIRQLVNKLFGIGPLTIVLLGYWLWRVTPDGEIASSDRQGIAMKDLSALAPLTSLLMFPVLLTMFSFLVQPAMMPRYAIVATLPLGVLAAWLASTMSTRLGRAVRTVLVVVLILGGVAEQLARAKVTDIADARIGSATFDAKTVIEKNGPQLVIFLRRHELYPAVYMRPDLAKLMAQLCFETHPEGLTRSFFYEEQMGRRVQKYYPQYQVAEFSQLQKRRQFFVVVPVDAGANLQALFPNARLRQHAHDLWEVILP